MTTTNLYVVTYDAFYHRCIEYVKNIVLITNTVYFILDFLTNREQRVRINYILSTVLSISTGAPQGCVLCAILFIIYTNDRITITFQELSSDQIC